MRMPFIAFSGTSKLSKSAFDLNYPILARNEKKVVPVQMIGYMRRCQQDEDERHCPPGKRRCCPLSQSSELLLDLVSHFHRSCTNDRARCCWQGLPTRVLARSASGAS